MSNDSIGRLPPNAPESERGALGCYLQCSPEERVEWLGDARSLTRNDFFDLRNRAIFDCIVELSSKNLPVTPITVVQTLSDNNTLGGSGGFEYISALSDATPSAANFAYFRDILREKSARRRVIAAAQSVVSEAFESNEPIDSILDRSEAAILEVRRVSNQRPDRELRDHVLAFVENIQQRCLGRPSGVPTGFVQLDRIVGSLRPEEMTIIAARPSTGKTAMALNIATHVASTGAHVGFFSLEMSAPQLVERAVASFAALNTFRAPYWGEREQQQCMVATNRISKLPLHIDDDPGLTVNAIRSRARRMKVRHNVQLVVVDYLQLVTATGGEDRHIQVGKISKGLKDLARELKIPILVLAQLNREMEREKARKPRLSDLRESGSIEQDGDTVCLLYKSNPEQNPLDPLLDVNLIVAKQRNGPTGEVPFTFHREYTKFETKSPIEA